MNFGTDDLEIEFDSSVRPCNRKLIFCDNCDKIYRFLTLNISKFETKIGKSDFK